MKIFLSFLQDKTEFPHPIASYRFWSYYVKNGITEAGMSWVEATEVDWAAGLVPYENTIELEAWKEISWTKTLEFIKKNQHQIDIFLSYLYPKQIDVNAINEIKKLGIPCVNFYCDHVREYATVPSEFKAFDLIWVPEFEALDMYNHAKQKSINLPMPIWIEPKQRFLPKEMNSSITFIGTKDSLRARLLTEVIAKKLPVQISGNGWIKENNYPDLSNIVLGNKFVNQMNFIKKYGFKGFFIKHLQKFDEKLIESISENYLSDALTFDEYIRKTKESAITLGINRVTTYKALNRWPICYSRLRDLEAPMLGGCYLTEHTKGLEKLYDVGSEIETYKTVDELIYKSGLLLEDKNKRIDLRKRGQAKALNNHSLPSSLVKIKAALF